MAKQRTPMAAARVLIAQVAMLASLALMAVPVVAAGTWVPLTNQAPDGIGTMLLLANGTVLAQGSFSSTTGNTWYLLTPDSKGSYINGTWTQAASMTYPRLYYSSDVLPNGKVFVAGGEYPDDLSSSPTAELYDPVANTWTTLPPSGQSFEDAISTTLPNGDVLDAPVTPSPSGTTIIYDYRSNTWIPGPTLVHGSNQDECSWVKLADGSILSIDSEVNTSERYIPSLNEWVNDAQVPVPFWQSVLGEMGPVELLPNGQAFFPGGTGNTVLYNPTGNTNPGTWTVGPVIPNSLAPEDAPSAMMANGIILCAYGPLDPLATYNTPTSFFEYDPTSNTFNAVGAPGGSEPSVPYVERMLDTPDGNVLYTDESKQLYEYIPSGPQLPAGQPAISSISNNPDGSHLLTGTLLTGISQGASYGDDAQMDSNYPIVTLTDGSGNVHFATTYDWNTTNVMQGSTPETADFTVPSGLTPGQYSLVATVNGISSTATPFTVPVFSLTANPTSLALNQGSSTTTTVSISPTSGFSGSVVLSASNLPNGVTAAFGGTATTNQVLTLTASDSAAIGPATISITGTSGGATETITLNIIVNANYTLSATPSTVTINQRTSGTSTIDVLPNGGFAGQVTFTATGLPSGVSATFSPNPAGTSSVLTLSANASAAIGSATITVTGTSGPFTAQTTVDLTVNGNFTLSANPGSLSINQGNNGSSTISVVPTGGFAGNVTFTASGLPSGVVASFSPTSSGTSSLLTLTTSSNAATGPFTVTITGTSGSLTNTTTIDLTMLGNYTISSNPSSVTVNQGSTGTSAISVLDTGGFSDSVAFTVGALPTGVTASFSPTSSATSTLLTLTASDIAVLGPATVTITGTDGILKHTTTVALTVNVNYTLSASPAALTVNQRLSGTSTITIAPKGGFTGAVAFTASGLPSGVTATFSPTSSTTGTVLTLAASATAATSTVPATVTITGTSGVFSETTTIALTVAGNFTISPSPANVTINQRTSGTTTIAVATTGGFSDPVVFTASGLPAGVTPSFSPGSSPTSTVLTLAADATAAVGNSTVTITGTDGNVVNTTTVNLTVNGNYTLSAGPSTLAVKQGHNISSTVSVADTGGFTDPVLFSASGLPTGVTATFSPTSSPTSTNVTLTADDTATLGAATVTITGTSGVLTNTTTIALTVNVGWTLTGFTLAPASVNGGSVVTGTVTISDPAPPFGETVALSMPTSASTYLTLPSSVTLTSGETTIPVTIQTHTVNSNEPLTVSATLGAITIPASLNISFVNGGTQAPGLEFFSFPWAYQDYLTRIFEYAPPSGEIASYTSGAYNYLGGTASSPTQVTITPGIGYWAVFPSQGENLLYLGTPASSTVATTVALSAGYNSIGDPYTSSVNISTLTFGSSKLPFSQAASATANMISPTLYYFSQDISGASGSYVSTGASGALVPGKGYWIYAFTPTTVTFPLPSTPANPAPVKTTTNGTTTTGTTTTGTTTTTTTTSGTSSTGTTFSSGGTFKKRHGLTSSK